MKKATKMKIVQCVERGRFMTKDKSEKEGKVFWEGDFTPIQYFLDNGLIKPVQFHYVWTETGDKVVFAYDEAVGEMPPPEELITEHVPFLII